MAAMSFLAASSQRMGDVLPSLLPSWLSVQSDRSCECFLVFQPHEHTHQSVSNEAHRHKPMLNSLMRDWLLAQPRVKLFKVITCTPCE
jgi:hypothetical protein